MLISEPYRALCAEMHRRRLAYGSSGKRFAPTVARLIERDGYVSQETFCREMGGTTPMAGWYLARMVRLGKLVRVGRCMYEIAKKSEAAE